MKIIKISKTKERLEKKKEEPEAERVNLEEVFGLSGPFTQKFAGYLPRESQINFALAVDEAVVNERHLLAQAETGVGKGVGYLTPIIMNHRGKKTIVVTANIALQEQLFRKDLPMLKETLGVDFTFSLAKGFSNYLCRFGIEESERALAKGKVKLPMYEREVFDKVKVWQTETGDLSDFEIELPKDVKKLVTTSTEDCYGRECPYFTQGCFPKTAKKKARSSDIIVTNYHLYFLDLEMKMTSGGEASILPEHDIVVFDEAHAAPSIAASFLGQQVTIGSIRAAVDYLDARDRRAALLDLPRELNLGLKSQIDSEADAYFFELVKLRNDKSRYRARIDVPGMVDGVRLASLLFQAADIYIKAASEEGLKSEARSWLAGCASRCKKQAAVIEGAHLLEDEFNIFYIETIKSKQKVSGQTDIYATTERAILNREPLSAGSILKRYLFESEEKPTTAICCSATLIVGKENPFGFISRGLGCYEADECVSDSPFDFTKTAFIVPSDIPEPNTKSEIYPKAVAHYLAETVEAAQGRTLGLFTSYDMLNYAHKSLIDSGCPYTVLKQGDAPRMTLIKRFKEEEDSILLGTDSFWTGVDVPGESLLAVFIDKLPFIRMDDPRIDALKMKEPEKWFHKYYLPAMLMQFKQGVGRLIRSVNDRGIIVCCDRRVLVGRYARSVRNSLPYDMKVLTDMKSAAMVCWPGSNRQPNQQNQESINES